MINHIFDIPTPEQLRDAIQEGENAWPGWRNNRIDFLEYISNVLPQNSTSIELGVLHGDHAEEILKTVNPGKLFLVDPWVRGYKGEEGFKNIQNRFLKEEERGTVVFEREFSYNIVDKFPDNFFDFIYIDACHRYESVKSDLDKYLPKLKKEGLMCGHDYQICERKNMGVVQAVDEFVNEHGFEWFSLSVFTDWALKKA